MAPSINLKIDDREFQQTLREYVMVSKRTIPEIVNTKAYYIVRRAIYETPKADKMVIGKSLAGLIYAYKDTKGGARRMLKTVTRYGRWNQATQVPLAALLVNWKRGQMGKAGLYGQNMAAAVKGFIASRQRSVAFIRSGWLPALRILAPFVKNKAGAAPLDSETKQYGRARGRATPASEGFHVSATIVNAIGEGAKDADAKAAALDKYAQPALQRAFDAEEASMRQYMEDELRKSAKFVGIRTN